MNNWPSWATSRPTSTGEYVTASECSDMHFSYPESETGANISEPKNQQPTETIRDQIEKIIKKELSKIELKSGNRKLEYEIKRIQEKLERLTIDFEASENSRNRLEQELIDCYSRIDLLETHNRRFEIKEKFYQALLKTYRNKNNELIECKHLG